MDSNRVERWTSELRTRVGSELGNDRKRNVIWLAEHLAEYIQRWIGFSLVREIGVSGTFNTDAFCIILGAAQVVNEQAEKRKDPWFPVKEWEEFENMLDYIQDYPSEENLSMVTESFTRFKGALP